MVGGGGAARAPPAKRPGKAAAGRRRAVVERRSPVPWWFPTGAVGHGGNLESVRGPFIREGAVPEVSADSRRKGGGRRATNWWAAGALLLKRGQSSAGTIVRWCLDGDDEALWHVLHDDGDEEDLDEKEAQEAVRNEKNAKKVEAKEALLKLLRTFFEAGQKGAVVSILQQVAANAHVRGGGGCDALRPG